MYISPATGFGEDPQMVLNCHSATEGKYNSYGPIQIKEEGGQFGRQIMVQATIFAGLLRQGPPMPLIC